MNIRHLKKLCMVVRLSLSNSGRKKAEYLKKNGNFKMFGEKNYWYSRIIPADMDLISVHDNVKVATNVYFCTHDVLHDMFNDAQEFVEGGVSFKRYSGEIEIFNNVFIGANSTIMYGVKIGPNAIVAANSVVTKDVAPGTVVAGNPAKVIGRYETVAKKRMQYNEK